MTTTTWGESFIRENENTSASKPREQERPVKEDMSQQENPMDNWSHTMEGVVISRTTSESTMNETITAEEKTANAVVWLNVGIAAVSTIFKFVWQAVYKAFSNAFYHQAHVTWGLGLITAFAYTAYAVVATAAVVAWWAPLVAVVVNTMTFGAVLTIVNFTAQVVWNIVKKPATYVASVAVSVVSTVATVVVKVVKGVANWIKGLFTKSEVEPEFGAATGTQARSVPQDPNNPPNVEDAYDHRRHTAAATMGVVG